MRRAARARLVELAKSRSRAGAASRLNTFRNVLGGRAPPPTASRA